MNSVETPRYLWVKEAPFFSSPEDFLKDRKKAVLQSFQHMLSTIPDPFLMKDLKKASERIALAIDLKEKITVFGDYDVDGTTSCAMLRKFFSYLSYDLDIYIPCRLTEGYGLNIKGVEKVAAKNTKLIITVDNGISAREACSAAKACGVDVIITDHHNPPPILPEDAYAIINPKQSDDHFPFKELAGVGVAFYLLMGLRRVLNKRDLPLNNLLDFVAIGSIADMVPLIGLNYIFSKAGLELLNRNLEKKFGLKKLLEISTHEGVIDSEDIAFKVAPCLNAAGRLGSALAAEELLSTTDQKRAEELASFLYEENILRRTLEKVSVEEAKKMLNTQEAISSGIIIYNPEWHLGIVGLIASKIVEHFYKPTLVFTKVGNFLKGSGRSVEGFDLFSALVPYKEEFISFGGHAFAVGITIEENKLPFLKEIFLAKIDESAEHISPLKKLKIAGELDLQKVSLNFIHTLETLAPYGMGNPRSRWIISSVFIKDFKFMGKTDTKAHAKVLFCSDSQEELWMTVFNIAETLFLEYQKKSWLKIVIDTRISSWNNKIRKDVRLVDFSPIH